MASEDPYPREGARRWLFPLMRAHGGCTLLAHFRVLVNEFALLVIALTGSAPPPHPGSVRVRRMLPPPTTLGRRRLLRGGQMSTRREAGGSGLAGRLGQSPCHPGTVVWGRAALRAERAPLTQGGDVAGVWTTSEPPPATFWSLSRKGFSPLFLSGGRPPEDGFSSPGS